jgi:diacylglycerol kinase (ATP)
MLRSRSFQYRMERDVDPASVRRLASDALTRGDRFVVAVGGDRLVNEIVNGMMGPDDRPRDPPPVLGVVAAGENNDFLRTFGLPGDATATLHLAGDRVYPIDVGRITCVHGGDERSLYFANIGEAGFGARVVLRTGARGRVAHFRAFWSEVLHLKKDKVRVKAAAKSYEGPAYNVVVGNGRFGGGGWRISPRSFPGDGVLEVLIMKGTRADTFTTLPLVYRGEQVPHPNIVELRGRDVHIEAQHPWPVHVDGRFVGYTPAVFRAIPRAILLKV